MRKLICALVASAAIFAAKPASAATLIGYDNAAVGSIFYFLSDTGANLGTSWTQTSAVSNASLEVLVRSNIGAASADWYLTRAIGPTTTPADVVASGTYSAPSISTGPFTDDAYTVLIDGLSIEAGTYFLVLDGPAGGFFNNYEWVGVTDGGSPSTLANGFTVNSIFGVSSFGGTVAEFAPSSPFGNSPGALAFRLSAPSQVPEPTALGLLGLGVLGLAASRRRRA